MQTDTIIVCGGRQLSGTIAVRGAKNSVLKLMAASLLCEGTSTIYNVPDISDVLLMKNVLERLGAVVNFQDGQLAINATSVNSWVTPYELVNQMRASTAVLGPLLGRFGQAKVAMPGGCQIGTRKMDMHFTGLEALGVTFEFAHGLIDAKVNSGGLKGADVALEFASVGATENLMVAATCAKGTTTIENAAREPEIVDLAEFLKSMGAEISGAGSPVITIRGTKQLAPVQKHYTVGDRIEAGTFLVAGALCQGSLTVTGIDPAHLTLPLIKLEEFGCQLQCEQDSITIKYQEELQPVDIQTLPYPGFPTDLQAQFMVLDAVTKGSSVITENVFENRFMFADELNRMGANVRIDGHRALIQGVEQLSGAPVQAPDLRAGAGLLLAGLIADGKTIVSGTEHIKRGYEDIVGRLAAIGADIQYLSEQTDERQEG